MGAQANGHASRPAFEVADPICGKWWVRLPACVDEPRCGLPPQIIESFEREGRRATIAGPLDGDSDVAVALPRGVLGNSPLHRRQTVTVIHTAVGG